MPAFRPMAPYLRPHVADRVLPVFYRSTILRRAVLSLPAGSRLRRTLMARLFGWSYRRFNTTGKVPSAVFCPKAELTQTGALIDTAGTFHGRDGVDQALAELREAFEGVRFEPERVAELPDDRFLYMVRFQASGRASGVSIDRIVGHLFEVQGGCAARWGIYWEESDALKAAGMPPG
ncbi:MAG: nuclear transport factor 2 family protein [Thermoleophilaceae bacterium]